MAREMVIETIETLAMSSGFYGRLLENLEYMMDNDPDRFDAIMNELEKAGDAVGLIMMIEG